MLLNQMEDERVNIIHEIKQIIHQSSSKQTKQHKTREDQNELGKANKLQLIIKLKDLKIEFEEPRILNMEDKDIIFLSEILENYIKILHNKRKYMNV